MKKTFLTILMGVCVAGATFTSCSQSATEGSEDPIKNYSVERFADIEVLRYQLPGFNELTLQQKEYIYYLSQATNAGRDITWDQFGKYNIKIRTILEAIYTCEAVDKNSEDFKAMSTYLKRVWFSNGIYHHYANDKFKAEFSKEFLKAAAEKAGVAELIDEEIEKVIFDDTYLAKKVNKDAEADVVLTSAGNFYEGVTQAEVEALYKPLEAACTNECPSYGLNSKVIKADGKVTEQKYTADGLYGAAIKQIIYWLDKARSVAENEKQKEVISTLIEYYETGDLATFDKYAVQWVQETEGDVDFVNGFTEVYDDPLGRKGTWEGVTNYKDKVATKRTETISANAQWFEDNSPVDPKFRKPQVRGIVAKVICATMLGGGTAPSTAIGINLPNANWIRAEYGSKSVTISNITDAYDKAARGNGFNAEFIADAKIREGLEKYGQLYDDLHTDLHECLGHGSGRLNEGVTASSLGIYHSAIEEARADLFGLYYMADQKLVDLGITPNATAYESYYYRYIMNGAMTQLTRIELGNNIEEAHMQDRALIANWCLKNAPEVVSLVKIDDKTYVEVKDFKALRQLFGKLLFEIQRITSEGDIKAAQELIETYAVKVDTDIHEEILNRISKLSIAPYKGFVNPLIKPVYDASGKIVDFEVSYNEMFDEQMLRYSKEFGFLK